MTIYRIRSSIRPYGGRWFVSEGTDPNDLRGTVYVDMRRVAAGRHYRLHELDQTATPPKWLVEQLALAQTER